MVRFCGPLSSAALLFGSCDRNNPTLGGRGGHSSPRVVHTSSLRWLQHRTGATEQVVSNATVGIRRWFIRTFRTIWYVGGEACRSSWNSSENQCVMTERENGAWWLHISLESSLTHSAWRQIWVVWIWYDGFACRVQDCFEMQAKIICTWARKFEGIVEKESNFLKHCPSLESCFIVQKLFLCSRLALER